ncbi:MAG: hypothetical protein PHU40_02230 [Sulfurimonas sp.]|nr:hypothetical protein [Sulfurimonas sp.]
MKKFKLFLLLFQFLLVAAFSACSSSVETSSATPIDDPMACPKCHMKVEAAHLHTATLLLDGKTSYFDDIGCLILWAHSNNISLEKNVKVFTNDTKRYINADLAKYRVNDTTPMMYGFSAHETEDNGYIKFDEVILRMLRGENMTNPKIRKQLLKG